MQIPMTQEEADRFHAATKIIEADGCEGYFSCRERFGADVAGAVLVMFLRLRLNPDEQWPAPEDLPEKVNEVMRKSGRLV